MRAIGQSFLQQDIAVFSQNIATLQLLNSKWRLYGRAVFREELLAEFLTVLIRVLVARSHNLLREDIGAAVFGLASVDLAAFHAAFLPSLLAEAAASPSGLQVHRGVRIRADLHARGVPAAETIARHALDGAVASHALHAAVPLVALFGHIEKQHELARLELAHVADDEAAAGEVDNLELHHGAHRSAPEEVSLDDGRRLILRRAGRSKSVV